MSLLTYSMNMTNILDELYKCKQVKEPIKAIVSYGMLQWLRATSLNSILETKDTILGYPVEIDTTKEDMYIKFV